MARHVVRDPEVGQRQATGRASLQLVEGALPPVQVDLRRRRRREDEPAGSDPDACRIPRIERPVLVEVRHMVRGVTRSWEALEPDHPLPDEADVLLRYRRELAPQRVERVAVQPPGACLEPRRVDEVRGADSGDVHEEVGVLAHEHSGGARVIEMDVREEQVTLDAQLDAALAEGRDERGHAARRAAVVKREAVGCLDEVRADEPRIAAVEEVERVVGHDGTLPTDEFATFRVSKV